MGFDLRVLLVFVHTGVLVALVALALLQATAAALGIHPGGAAAMTVFAGTLAVYAFDRLVDDCVGRPGREGFVRRHPRTLAGLAAAAGIVALIAGLRLPTRAIVILASVVLLAGAHAWLRRIAWVKPLYIAVAWLLVVVGLPAALAAAPLERIVAELAPIGLAIVANVLACDAADREAESLHVGVRRTWWLARAIAVLGVAIALAGPASFRALASVPAFVALALVPYRPVPTYTSTVVDAAVGAGALVAWLWVG